MSRQAATRVIPPFLLLVAFFLTLSTLAVRDRLDVPARLAAEPAAVPVMVLPY